MKEETIKLDISKGGRIDILGGAHPYIWIGGETCFGCVPDADVERLRDACNRILKFRSAASRRERKKGK
jgi:hypothetical protein